MSVWLKQSTSVEVPIGPFVDETDGKTAETALTITQPDIRLKKNGGAWAQKNAAQTLSHEENGYYEVTLDATDTDTLGRLRVAVHESGALPVWQDFLVVPANVYDSLIAGSDTLQADVTQFGGTNATSSGGRPEVNASHAAGTAWNSGAIGAATLASDTITAAKIAADAITAAKIADGAIDAATFAAGAINAAAIATDAIDADALAADAVTEIQSGLSTLTAAQVNSEVDTAIADARLDELLAADSDIDGAAPPTVGSVFHELLSKTAGSFTFDQTTDSLEAVRDNMGTPQTGDSFARLGAPAGASVSADIAAIEAQTDDIGVAGAGLTAVPWNSAWDAEVQSEVQDAIEVNHLDHLLAVTYDPASKPGAADALLNELVESDAGVARYTANALEQAPTGGSAPTAAEVADAVWDETLADHLTAGSTGNALNAAGSAGDPWATAIPGAYGAGTAGKILGDNVNATISSRATQASVDTIDDLLDTEVAAIKSDTAAILADTGTDGVIVATNNDKTGYGLADGAITAAKIATDAITADKIAADAITSSEIAASAVTEIQSGLATAASLTTVEGKVDTIDGIVDAILVDTGTDIPALIDALPTATENATGVLDLAAGVEVGLTLRQALRLIAAASAGKLSGAATTTVVIRNAVADSKNRITATVDSDGNRDAIVVDLT